MLKHPLLALTLAGLIYAAPAVAQNSPAPDQASPSAQQQTRHDRKMDPTRRAEKLTKKLSLTADQQTKVQEIFKSTQSQMESLHNDSSLSRDDRRAKMMDVHKASSDQVRALLDSTQQKKWDEMQSQREKRHGHRNGGQAPPSNPGQ